MLGQIIIYLLIGCAVEVVTCNIRYRVEGKHYKPQLQGILLWPITALAAVAALLMLLLGGQE